MRFANAHRDAVVLVVSQQRQHVSYALGTEHQFGRCAPQCRVVGVNSIPVLSDSFARLRPLPLDRSRISVSAPFFQKQLVVEYMRNHVTRRRINRSYCCRNKAPLMTLCASVTRSYRTNGFAELASIPRDNPTSIDRISPLLLPTSP